MSSKVIQKGAVAGRDLVAGDVNTQNNYNFSSQSKIEKLLAKLQDEVEHNHQVQETIEDLARFFERTSVDGIDGLEAKIEHSPLNINYDKAIEKKEMFVKLLNKWSMYSTAQQIFVHFLARVENEFEGVIYPQIGLKSEAEINALVMNTIVKPVVEECGSDVFVFNDNVVLGMIYWLAEQCYIRWHS